MKKLTLAIIITILSVGALAGVYFFTIKEPSSSETPSISGQSESTDTFTTAEIAKHDAGDDCWTIIENDVYDITDYIPRHPGGIEEIVGACGTDGTSLFTERKTTDGEEVGSGTPHSSSAKSQLKKLKIGTLQQ